MDEMALKYHVYILLMQVIFIPNRNKFISLHDIQGQDWKKNDNLSLESR